MNESKVKDTWTVIVPTWLFTNPSFVKQKKKQTTISSLDLKRFKKRCFSLFPNTLSLKL